METEEWGARARGDGAQKSEVMGSNGAKFALLGASLLGCAWIKGTDNPQRPIGLLSSLC